MKNISLYIHYPFCKSKCPYCDFNSFANLKIDKDDLLEACLREINYYFQKLPNRQIETIFFGGGTPSLMSVSFLEAILNEINKLWQVDKNAEISLEANPSTAEINKFKDFKNLGINRLSLGIQALNDKDLKLLGRTHDTREALNSIDLARKIFKEKYSIDLIYTRPNQNLSDWEKELKKALKLSPYHLSLYQLTIEEGTPFYNRDIQIPSENLSRDFYELTNEITKNNNIPFYEISNYAWEGHKCKHNLNYWRSGEWIGVGAGAHGRISFQSNFVDGYRIRTALKNIKNPAEWMREVQEKGFGYEEKYDLTKEEFIEEFLLMGLRLREGMGLRELSKTLKNKSILDIVNIKNCKELEKKNFIEVSEKYIRVDEKSLVLLNKIIEQVIS